MSINISLTEGTPDGECTTLFAIRNGDDYEVTVTDYKTGEITSRKVSANYFNESILLLMRDLPET